jgi:SAM-dependent methyltransferase
MRDDLNARMRDDWNNRAQENARWYIASDVTSDDEFVASGAGDVDVALRRLDPRWLATARTLEIGCGAGRMSEFLLPRVRSLTGIDVSTEMIDLARTRLGSRPNLELIPTSGNDLALFADGSFDLIVSYVVLHHVPKSVVRDYFREIRRVLRPGGVFRGQLSEIRDPAFVAPSDTDTFSMRSWTPDEIHRELAGWSSVDLAIVPVTPTTDHIWITASPWPAIKPYRRPKSGFRQFLATSVRRALVKVWRFQD